MSASLALGTYQIFQMRSKKHYHFDQSSQTIMLLEKKSSGIHSKQIPFRDVLRLKHVIEPKKQSLRLVFRDDSEMTFQVSQQELANKAVYLSELIGVKLETVDGS